MSNEAMKLALEAFNTVYSWNEGGFHKTKEAIKALEEALAKQEQGKPVAKYIGECSEGSLVQLFEDVKKGTDFYTTP
jgi:hypothetical protein